MSTTITAELVKQLRDLTSAPMMACKQALQHTNGDIDAAVDYMREKGQTQASKKAGRTAAEGMVVCAMNEQGSRACLLEVNCETDFVARDETFTRFARAAAEAALAHGVADVDALANTALNTGETVEVARTQIVAKLGENVQVRRMIAVDAPANTVVGSYIHMGRIGAVVTLAGGDAALAKDMAMQVAASNPQVISGEEVPAEWLAKEKEIYTAQALESGKPANIVEKMIEGRLKKYCDEISLLGQPFLKNPDMTVAQVLAQAKVRVVAFTRFEVGEGIEKKVGNFAQEVMEQVQGSRA